MPPENAIAVTGAFALPDHHQGAIREVIQRRPLLMTRGEGIDLKLDSGVGARGVKGLAEYSVPITVIVAALSQARYRYRKSPRSRSSRRWMSEER